MARDVWSQPEPVPVTDMAEAIRSQQELGLVNTAGAVLSQQEPVLVDMARTAWSWQEPVRATSIAMVIESQQ